MAHGAQFSSPASVWQLKSVEVAPASGSSGLGTGSIFGSGGAVVAAVAVADGQFFWGRALLAGSAPSQSSIFGAGAIFVTDHHMSGETFRPYGARDGWVSYVPNGIMESWSHGVI